MKLRSNSCFTVVIAFMIAVAIFEARKWPLRANILILTLGGIGLILALVQLYKELHSSEKIQGSGMDIESEEDLGGKKVRPRVLAFGAWIFSLFTTIWLSGFSIGIPLFAFLYAKVNGARWLTSLIIAAVSYAFLQGLYEQLLHIPWPDPLLRQFIPFLPS